MIDDVRNLYLKLVECWNRQDAEGIGRLLTSDAEVIGFDGSVMKGPLEVVQVLGEIFQQYPTGRYITLFHDVRAEGDWAITRSASGMVPREGDDVNPAVNAWQTMLAVREGGAWKIRLFQNTPAAFHGRPEEARKMTAELREALRSGALLGK